MNRHFAIAALALAALGATACGRQCKNAREQIIQPTETVSAYLRTQPTGSELAMSGCDLVLKQFESIPRGAQTIRSIAETRFSRTYSRCLDWRDDYRYRCYPRGRGYPPACYPEHYQYCAAWDHDVVREPGYAQAMDLSRDLDVMDHRAHAMCGDAFAGRYDEAERAARDLVRYITAEVKPEGDHVYAMACGR